MPPLQKSTLLDQPQPPTVYTADAPSIMKGRRYLMKPNSELIFHGGSPPRHRKQFVLGSYGAIAPSVGSTPIIQIRSQETGIYTNATEPDDGFCAFIRGIGNVTLFTDAMIVVRNPSDTESISIVVTEIFYA